MGTERTWSAPPAGAIDQLSWLADDHALAFDGSGLGSQSQVGNGQRVLWVSPSGSTLIAAINYPQQPVLVIGAQSAARIP